MKRDPNAKQSSGRVPRGSGKPPIVLRDVFDDISVWIDRLVKCGDNIMQ